MANNKTRTKRIGSFQIIRSSTSRKAMVSGNPKYYDSARKLWFESQDGEFSDWTDVDLIALNNAFKTEAFRQSHPNVTIRESSWEIMDGGSDTVVPIALFCLTELGGKNQLAFSFTINNATVDELEEWKEAVLKWHFCGELRHGHFSWNPYWEM